MLKACLRDEFAVMGVGLGTLAAAYYDGCLTRRQCLHIVCCVMRTLTAWSQTQGRSELILSARCVVPTLNIIVSDPEQK